MDRHFCFYMCVARYSLSLYIYLIMSEPHRNINAKKLGNLPKVIYRLLVFVYLMLWGIHCKQQLLEWLKVNQTKPVFFVFFFHTNDGRVKWMGQRQKKRKRKGKTVQNPIKHEHRQKHQHKKRQMQSTSLTYFALKKSTIHLYFPFYASSTCVCCCCCFNVPLVFFPSSSSSSFSSFRSCLLHSLHSNPMLHILCHNQN